MTVTCEAVMPEAITYKRGSVFINLTGFLAGLYKGMVWMYGVDEATERFWQMWHKNEA